MTGLVHDSPVASLVLPVLVRLPLLSLPLASSPYPSLHQVRPILSGLERQDQGASQTLRAALSKVTLALYVPD